MINYMEIFDPKIPSEYYIKLFKYTFTIIFYNKVYNYSVIREKKKPFLYKYIL